MSAYVVQKTHIDALIGAALQASIGHGAFRWYTGTRAGGDILAHELTDLNADETGAMLWEENRRSVAFRYNGEAVGAVIVPFVHAIAHVPPIDPVRVLKAIRGYEYQTCEHPEWESSSAKAFCDSLTAHMVTKLRGYDDAKWEVTHLSQIAVKGMENAVSIFSL